MLVKISPMNVAKMRQHFLSLECEVDVIIGKNGWIWVYKKTDTEVPYNIRQRIVRVANCIKLLDKARKLVSGDTIVEAYNLLSSVPVNGMLREECLLQIKENLLSGI
jgi:exosome complex RNA-binding protein Rrp4